MPDAPAGLAGYDDLTPFERAALVYDWKGTWARPSQLEPEGTWRGWLIRSGRGFGKTRTGAEWVRLQIERFKRQRGALVGRTAADVRDVMVEGNSGLLRICPPWNRPHYEPSKRRLTWPNGAICTTYSADEPNLLRGPEHDHAWADELAAWDRADETWGNLMLGLRLKPMPQVIVTTTPRPTPLIRKLIADPTFRVTTGTTYENRANLSPDYIEDLERRFGKDSAIYRQEVLGEVLDDLARPYPLAMVVRCDAPYSTLPPFVWGWDFARAADETVGVALDVFGQVVRVERWTGVPWQETYERVSAAMWSPSGTVPGYGDKTGLGDPVVEALQRRGLDVLGVTFTARSRQTMLERLGAALTGQEVRGPFAGDLSWLATQLDAFEYETTASGPKYAAPDGVHDDGVMALALAVHGYDQLGGAQQAANRRAEMGRVSIGPDQDPTDWRTLVGVDPETGEQAAQAFGGIPGF